MIPFMKKLAAGLVLSMLLAGFCVTGSLQAESPPQVGEIVGQVLATDIKAQVNSSTLASMNIDGLTAVVAEDLRDYGFDGGRRICPEK